MRAKCFGVMVLGSGFGVPELGTARRAPTGIGVWSFGAVVCWCCIKCAIVCWCPEDLDSGFRQNDDGNLAFIRLTAILFCPT